MTTTEYFKNDYATVFQKDGDITVLKYFKKVPSHEHFLEVNKPVIEAFKAKPTQIMIADIRDMGILSIESQKWVSNTLLPTLLDLLKGKTLYHAQLLNSSEILSKVSANNVKRYAQSITSNFVMVQFDSEESMNSGVEDFRALIKKDSKVTA